MGSGSARVDGVGSNVTHKIHESLKDLALPLDALVPLPGNPRVGNVDAIAASYDEFGQLKPIVVRPNEDGTFTIIAGNHQAEACRRLGWSHVAAVQMADDDERTVAFALVDNRVSDLGRTDQALLYDLLNDVVDVYPELFDAVGWDDFEMSALDSQMEQVSEVGSGVSTGYVPPVLVARPGEPLPAAPEPITNPAVAVEDEDGDEQKAKFVAPAGIDQRAAAVGGASVTGQAGTARTSFQYTIVFDDADQMRRWWDFLRSIRNDPTYEGETIAATLMAFVDAHANF